MTEKEIIVGKIDNIINFIIEHAQEDVSVYSRYHYRKLILLLERVKKTVNNFILTIPGVLDESSYEKLRKNYQKILELTQEAIDLFIKNNIDTTTKKLKSIPVQLEKQEDYYELIGTLQEVIRIQRRRKERIKRGRVYQYRTPKEVSGNLYSTTTANNIFVYHEYNEWKDKLDLSNTTYGYTSKDFYANALMYALVKNLDYDAYYSLSSFLVEDYDAKKNKDMEKQEKETSITVDDVRMICTTLKYYELREMDVLLLWKERTALLKFLEDALEEPMLIEAAGGMDKINEAVERIDNVLQTKRWKGR